MRRFRFFCAPCSLLGLILSLVAGGCDNGSKSTEMVKPDTPPDVSAKASMDYYKSQMKNAPKK